MNIKILNGFDNPTSRSLGLIVCRPKYSIHRLGIFEPEVKCVPFQLYSYKSIDYGLDYEQMIILLSMRLNGCICLAHIKGQRDLWNTYVIFCG